MPDAEKWDLLKWWISHWRPKLIPNCGGEVWLAEVQDVMDTLENDMDGFMLAYGDDLEEAPPGQQDGAGK